MVTIILASGSPRRKYLLKQAGLPFKAVTPKLNERIDAGKSIRETVQRLAKEKVKSILSYLPQKEKDWVAGFDTICAYKGRLLGKPSCLDEAKEILNTLSGKIHSVHTGIALYTKLSSKIETDVCTTRVTFRKLSLEEIDFYLNTDEWKGVAGAYRIQGRGELFIHSISGSYSNVVGLPLSFFYGMLMQYQYPFHKGEKSSGGNFCLKHRK
jgi:septum formation protein